MGGVCFTIIGEGGKPKNPIELKAKLLCEGMSPDNAAAELFRKQNPSNVKRGGLSSGGKMKLASRIFVNAPFYRQRKTDLTAVADPENAQGVVIMMDGKALCKAEAIIAPDWYSERVGDFKITQILTAHNRQLAGAVYEDCALFALGRECKFCVINRSLQEKSPALVNKTGGLIVSALEKIPVEDYGGLTLNGGMTLKAGRGMERIVPIVEEVSAKYPSLQVAVEITPPADLDWINRMADAGAASLMMNLETWDGGIRAKLIPGKNEYCPKESYLAAFERAIKVFGPGRVSTCFVVGTESIESLKKGISAVIGMGVMPSPLAGRYFEEIADYPFAPNVNWRDFLDIVNFASAEAVRLGVKTTDKVGCFACGMCDLLKDVVS